jgi:hypothetical protein
VRRQIVLLAQYDGESTTGGIAGDAGAVDTAADDQQVAACRLSALHLRLS